MFEFLMFVLTPGKTPGAGSVVAGLCSSIFQTRIVPTQVGSGVHHLAAAAAFPPPLWLEVLVWVCVSLFVFVVLAVALGKWLLSRSPKTTKWSLDASIVADEEMDGRELASRIDLALANVRGVRSVDVTLSDTCSIKKDELLGRIGPPGTVMPLGSGFTVSGPKRSGRKRPAELRRGRFYGDPEEVARELNEKKES